MTIVRKKRPKKGAKKKARSAASKKRSDPRNIPAMAEKMWKPGQSGNPAGRKPGKTIEMIVLEMLDHKIKTDDGDKISRMEALAAIILDEVINRRNPQLIKQILDRIWPAGVDVNFNAKGGFTIVFDDQDREA